MAQTILLLPRISTSRSTGELSESFKTSFYDELCSGARQKVVVCKRILRYPSGSRCQLKEHRGPNWILLERRTGPACQPKSISHFPVLVESLEK